jgi:hypothetical protein
MKNNTPSREDEEICNSTREKEMIKGREKDQMIFRLRQTAQTSRQREKEEEAQPTAGATIPQQFLVIFSTLIHN